MLMKKFITLLLVLTGMVLNVSADDWVVAGDAALVNGDAWSTSNTANKMTQLDASHYYLIVTDKTLSGSDGSSNVYNFKITEYKSDGTWNDEKTYPSAGVGGNYGAKFSNDGTYSLIYTFNSDTHDITITPFINFTLSNNYNGASTWDTDNSSYYLTYNGVSDGKAQWSIDLNAATIPANKTDWYFRLWNSGVLQWNTGHKLSASSDGDGMAIAADATTVSYSDNSYSWKITYPSYPFDHFTIGLAYDLTNNQWEVSADAYISKTVSGTNEYATLGSIVPLDITELPSGVTAYTLSVTEKGKINKAAKSTTLLANKGVLLHNTSGSDKVLSIPVAASGTADASNDLVGIIGGEILYQPVSDYTYYLLGIQADHVGFYKVNTTDGNMMGANTAYLKVPNALASAHYLMDFDDDVTSINAIETNAAIKGEYFNLAGQRVAQPTKGLYIVNGKKVIMK